MPNYRPELTESDSELVIRTTNHNDAPGEESRFLPGLGPGEESFQLIFKAAQDAIFIKDCDLRYVYINSAAERLFGVSASKIVGLTAEAWLDAEGAAHAAQVDHRVLKGEVVEKEINYMHKQPPLIFQVLKFPMRNASGEIIGLCGIAHDITKHKQIETMLQRAQADLEQRVAERTAALSAANAQLKEQIIERKRAEVKLAEEHNLLRTLIDNLPDFIFVKDIVNVIQFLLKRPFPNGLYNVGTGRARSFNDLARATFAAVNKKTEIEYFEMPELLKERYQYFTESDVGKLREAGYTEEFTDLEEGVKAYVAYLLKEIEND